MRDFLRDLESAWWRFIHPEFDEPAERETSPAALRQWANRKGGEGDAAQLGLVKQGQRASGVPLARLHLPRDVQGGGSDG